MSEIRTETEVEARPEQLWRVLTDFTRYPEWNPFLVGVTGAAVPGGRVIVSVKTPLVSVPLHCVVMIADANRELRWRGHLLTDGLVAGEHYFVIEPRGEKRTLFIHGEIFTGAISSIAWAIIERDTRRGYARMNAAFKARCESLGPAGREAA